MMRINPVTRILTLPTLARLGLLLVLVVAVFLAESFTSLMERALRYGGGSSDIFVLLMYQAPGIIDLALALGVLIALFFALLEARDRGELIILATSGVRWTRVLGFVLWFGFWGLSIGIRIGFVVPVARYAERLAMTELRAEHVMEAIVSPGPRNARQTIKDMTFIATPPAHADQLRGQLFNFLLNPDKSWRAVQSQDWDVIREAGQDTYEIRLNTTVAYESPAYGPRMKTRLLSPPSGCAIWGSHSRWTRFCQWPRKRIGTMNNLFVLPLGLIRALQRFLPAPCLCQWRPCWPLLRC